MVVVVVGMWWFELGAYHWYGQVEDQLWFSSGMCSRQREREGVCVCVCVYASVCVRV